jgi:hypothetical protein
MKPGEPLVDLIGSANETLTRVAALSVLSGVLLALLGAGMIYLGSTLVPPRAPRGRVWADWRRHRMVWGLGVLLPALAVVPLSDLVWKRYALHDLFWLTHPETIERISRLGCGCGYLLGLFVLTMVPICARQMGRRR